MNLSEQIILKCLSSLPSEGNMALSALRNNCEEIGRMDCIQFIFVTAITQLAMCVLFPAPSPPSWDVAPSVSSLCSMSLSFQFSVTLAVLQNLSPLTANINSTFHEFSMCLSCKCCLWLTLDTLQVHCFVLLSVLVLHQSLLDLMI